MKNKSTTTFYRRKRRLALDPLFFCENIQRKKPYRKKQKNNEKRA